MNSCGIKYTLTEKIAVAFNYTLCFCINILSTMKLSWYPTILCAKISCNGPYMIPKVKGIEYVVHFSNTTPKSL